MRPLKVLRHNEGFTKALEVIRKADVARLHGYFDAIAVGLREPALRIIGQMQDLRLEFHALHDFGELFAVCPDKRF